LRWPSAGFRREPVVSIGRGLPPAADEQFIDRERIKEAQLREPQSLSDDPLICGVDFSGGGAAWNVAASAAVKMRARSRGSGSPASIRAIAACWWANWPLHDKAAGSPPFL
jgi:hypothetical protein